MVSIYAYAWHLNIHIHNRCFAKENTNQTFLDILEKRIFSKEAYVRSDNAGCFHGFASIYAMPFLSSEIKCAHMDFADHQGGKCICDKKSITSLSSDGV